MELFTQRKFSSTLNPDAPSFVPLAYRTVEDFSDPWWALFHSSPSFRDYWLQQERQANQEQYQDYDPAYAMVDDLLADDPVLPEDDDSLFNDIFLAVSDKTPFASSDNYSGFEEEKDNYREFSATEQEVVEFPRYAEKLLDFNMTPKMIKQQPRYSF